MNDRELKLTDLDYATGDHHLQMIKAALPYLDIRQQRALSLFVKTRELLQTMDFFRENDDGMMSICSIDEAHTSPEDMLAALKPFANKREQDVIDLFTRFLSTQHGQQKGAGFTPKQLISLLPPDMQMQFETIQMVLQNFPQGGSSYGKSV